jgi:hypothetical protein
VHNAAADWGIFMNIKRGLFRLWVVLTLLWVVGVAFVGGGNITSDTAWGGQPWLADPIAAFPVLCSDYRGKQGADFQVKRAFEPWNEYRQPSQACWYDAAKFRQLWPEYKDLSDNEVMDKLYTRLDWYHASFDPLYNTKVVLMKALIPPAVIFVIGFLFVWAFSGFARPKTP